MYICILALIKPFQSCYFGDQVTDDETGRTCSILGGEMRNTYKILVELEGEHLRDLGICGRMKMMITMMVVVVVVL
jgi:hypothetical protein